MARPARCTSDLGRLSPETWPCFLLMQADRMIATLRRTSAKNASRMASANLFMSDCQAEAGLKVHQILAVKTVLTHHCPHEDSESNRLQLHNLDRWNRVCHGPTELPPQAIAEQPGFYKQPAQGCMLCLRQCWPSRVVGFDLAVFRTGTELGRARQVPRVSAVSTGEHLKLLTRAPSDLRSRRRRRATRLHQRTHWAA